MTSLRQSLIFVATRGVIYGAIMLFIAYLLEIYSPLRSWEQLGTIVALAAFIIKFYDDNSLKSEHRIGGLENSIEILEGKYAELSSLSNILDGKTKEIESTLDRLNIQVVEHLKLYGHKEASADVRKLQQEVLAIQAELRFGFDISDLRRKLEKMEKAIENCNKSDIDGYE